MNTKLIVSHVTGNANVRAALSGFIKAKILFEFHVTIASIPNSLLDRIGAIRVFSEIRRRRFDKTIKPFLFTWPWWELGRVIAQKARLDNFINPKTGIFNIDIVIQKLDKQVAKRIRLTAKNGLNTVYGYEDSSVFTFREAKKQRLRCLYDLPIGYWRTGHILLGAEKDVWPDWVATLPGLNDSDEKLKHKDEELRLADKIFVASTFTANTLKDFPGKLAPVEVIPYGFPAVSNGIRIYQDFKTKRPLKLLYVGSLSQRKGIANLFEAVKHFGELVELTIVGRKNTENCTALNNALSQYKWINSLPHDKVLKLMRENDILVFPSLFEGFGLVITEAMSQGTPVITTDRTAGPDIIEHGKSGWLIKAGCTEALKSTIEEILQKPEVIKEVGMAAMEKARQRPWEVYGKELAAAITRID